MSLGGTLTGEHGIGAARVHLLGEQRGPEAVRVMQAIKSALDPQHLLNPGRAVPLD
jgi:FAD/FMN-containing dehydrogenase